MFFRTNSSLLFLILLLFVASSKLRAQNEQWQSLDSKFFECYRYMHDHLEKRSSDLQRLNIEISALNEYIVFYATICADEVPVDSSNFIQTLFPQFRWNQRSSLFFFLNKKVVRIPQKPCMCHLYYFHNDSNVFSYSTYYLRNNEPMLGMPGSEFLRDYERRDVLMDLVEFKEVFAIFEIWGGWKYKALLLNNGGVKIFKSPNGNNSDWTFIPYSAFYEEMRGQLNEERPECRFEKYSRKLD